MFLNELNNRISGDVFVPDIIDLDTGTIDTLVKTVSPVKIDFIIQLSGSQIVFNDLNGIFVPTGKA